MKVEVGESIVYSWLRHSKGCQIVQLNWKTSPEWKTRDEQVRLQKLMNKARKKFSNPFKQTVNIEQLLRQAEIDGIGINVLSKEIHAADVAFHESGLNYGGKTRTVQNVVKKYLRTAFALEYYFPKTWKPNIYFISPKIAVGTTDELSKELSELRRFFSKEDLKTKLHLIANDDFNDQILEEMKRVSLLHSDTSELFLRSVQLINMFT